AASVADIGNDDDDRTHVRDSTSTFATPVPVTVPDSACVPGSRDQGPYSVPTVRGPFPGAVSGTPGWSSDPTLLLSQRPVAADTSTAVAAVSEVVLDLVVVVI
ncbi:hypothetical protein BaRGS_00035586, partial [Batillaria attramentaria]